MTDPHAEGSVFELHASDVTARAQVQGHQFVVLAGSMARRAAAPSLATHSYANLRPTLIEQGAIADTGQTHLIFNRDTPFNSPSAAAVAVLARASNGRTSWKVQGTDTTYGEWSDAHAILPTVFDDDITPLNPTWKPFFQELAVKLLGYEDRQAEMIQTLRDVEIKVNDDEGEALLVLDPFSFFSLILKHNSDASALPLFAKVGAQLGLSSPAPTDLTGVPWSDPRSALYFPYRSQRTADDVPTLWRLARQAVSGVLDAQTFEAALGIRKVALAKLTQGLFWINPDRFLALNGVNVPYLKARGVEGADRARTLRQYQAVLDAATALAPDFASLSHAAWSAAQRGEVSDTVTPVADPVEREALVSELAQMPAVPLNQILYGPPGTGKTHQVIERALAVLDPAFLATHVHDRPALKARYDACAAAGAISFVTFHQSFGYEDFIEGIKPGMQAGQLSYQLQDGIFLEAVRAAGGALDGVPAPESARPHVLIIDEINRGNVARIFGELITLLEAEKRAGRPEALSARLPLSRRVLSVPQTLYVIGTMNTADRSLTQLDTALRRRFVFHPVWPRPELLPVLEIEGEALDLRRFLHAINERLEGLLSREQVIGHAYLLGLPATLAGVASALRERILPQLEEYFFDDWDKIRDVLADPGKPLQLQFVQKTEGGHRINEAALTELEAFTRVYADGPADLFPAAP